MLLISLWLQHESYRGIPLRPESKSTLSGAGAGKMRATVFPFIAFHPVAETVKRSAIQRLEQPSLLSIRSNDSGCAAFDKFGSDNAADVSQETARSQPQKSCYSFHTSSKMYRLAPKHSTSSYLRHFAGRILRAANTALDEGCRNKVATLVKRKPAVPRISKAR